MPHSRIPTVLKLLAKLVGGLIALVLLVVCGGLGYVLIVLPRSTPLAADLKIEATPARLERGRYLVEHVAACTDCHSKRDWSQFAGPVAVGAEASGGDVFGRTMGLPGDFPLRNLTPTHLREWSDAELLRAITEGVNRHGEAMFPMMNYKAYGQLPTEDVHAIIAYVRSLPAVPEPAMVTRNVDGWFTLLLRTFPAKAEPKALDPTDRVAYGQRLATTAGCFHCHSKLDGSGAIVPGTTFGGGQVMGLENGGTVVTANLTPDAATGIGTWSEDQFVARFKMYAAATPELLTTMAKERQTIMPWRSYAGMTKDDLGAIYAFLRTVPPISNKVEPFRDSMPRAPLATH